MSKVIFTLATFLVIQHSIAQSVGINTGSGPHTSSMFEVRSTNKGVLIPRVALVATDDSSPIPLPAPSLLVYNTSTAGTGSTAVTPGYYYWNSGWVRLLSGSFNGWSLTGNAGSNPATNFIGTTDNQPLIFKVNGAQAGRLQFSRTLFGVDAGPSITSPSSNDAFGGQALFSNTVGARNTAIGFQSLYSNTSGNDNVGLGATSLLSNTTGSSNIGIGMFSLLMNTIGHHNTGIGTEVMNSNIRGNYNTAIGAEALAYDSNGSYNTAIGYKADYSSFTGSLNTTIGAMAYTANGSQNATAIGSYSYVGCNNCLVLGGTGPLRSVNVGIGNSTPSGMLHVSGNSNGGARPQLILTEDLQDFVRIKMMYTGATDGWSIEANPGTNAVMNMKYSTFANAFSLTSVGELYIMGNLHTNSDSRLKKNIEEIPSALEKITQLHGYNYNWVDENRDQNLQSGVLAQEVEKTIPHLVSKDEKGTLSVNYSGLVPYLIQSVKEQQQQIEMLKKENADLKKMKTEMEELKKMMRELKNK